MTTPIYILADDLAGAHDVAVPFAKRGFAVAVPTGPDRLDRFDSADLVVLNTDTRSCSEAEAADRVGAACEAIRARSGALIYKKIDSTLRGNVGFEIDLVSDLMDFGLVVCAPAFPEMGRITVGGYHLLGGLPISGADMAGPDIPPQHAFVPDLLDNGTGRGRVHIDLKTVHGGTAAIRGALDEIKAATGTTVVVDMADPMRWDGLLDAVFEDRGAFEDRRSSAPAAATTLLCGSGGMAGALAERLALRWKPRASSSRSPRSSSSKPRVAAPASPLKDGPVLVFACSLHDTTSRQVEQVNGRNSATICPFDPLSIVDERKRMGEVDRLTTSIAEAMANGRNAVVTPVRPDRTDRTDRRAWIGHLAEKAAGRDPALVVIENLGEVARRLFTKANPGGLVLTGGETAGRVFQELRADGAWIRDEIDAGIGQSAVAGGPHDGMGLVIKPGSFGDEHTLAKAMERLSPRGVDTLAGATPRAGDTKAGSTEAGNTEAGTITGGDTSAGDTPDGITGPYGKQASGDRKGNGSDERPVIGITLGDPNGVGPEVIVKILSQEWVFELCRPLVIGHDEVIRRALPLARTGSCLDIHPIEHPEAGLFRHGTIDVMNAQEAELEIDSLVPGRVQSEAGRLAVESVKRAARMAMDGYIAAMVTAPINKEAMSLAGYAYAGHTELLAEITGTKRFRLALAFDGILVSHATTHVSLRDAIDRLSEDEILITLDLVGNALAGMGVAAPRIAVCGLNPHAGEGGLFGNEEIRIIAPAIEKAREKAGARGWRITGPLPPDTVFMRARKGDFDGIIGMYHDQGHIPVKAIAFDRTVNVTLGLPIIRTSVDHGTAFDIAGKGIADAGNLGEALRMAVSLVGEQWSIGDGKGAQATS
ncbi:MAG: 4-hydroxythreonine-4-phosphate dehydrogenase PdxA [Gemmatimonadetes bacterium]|nr:4-hydroxythreonine-4-phosphate dehydrogenase PdxA [Gemmatimonadota bacterium]MYD25250.1 4-hydroxythreonine-4-phosphate dehydrogenase PdxA [Gemmatimonadota bacterium]MYJ00284.1 4-hydroxythreonine-4-phosphate dehydrogenase PdxA [Gemmatimonadota bacterium]